MHCVVVLAWLALLDDFLASGDRHRLKGVKQALDIGGRNAGEELRLQQGHQPVGAVCGLHFFHFHAAGNVVVGGLGAIQAQQLFEQRAAYAQHTGLCFCDGRHLSRLKLRQRLKGCALPAANALDEGFVGQHLEVALENVEREVVAITLPEQDVSLAQLNHVRLREQPGLAVGRQFVERNQITEAGLE